MNLNFLKLKCLHVYSVKQLKDINFCFDFITFEKIIFKHSFLSVI